MECGLELPIIFEIGSPLLVRLRTTLATACFATASRWSPLQPAAESSRRLATVLANPGGAERALVEATLRAVLADVQLAQNDVELEAWVAHVYRVTQTYWSGLFHGYDDPMICRQL